MNILKTLTVVTVSLCLMSADGVSHGLYTGWLALMASPTSQRVRDASNMLYSADFTDLYLIEAQDRSRMIHVFCGVSRCSKNRRVWMTG